MASMMDIDKATVVESAGDVPYKGPNKGRSGSGPSIVDFCPHGLGVALARSTTLTATPLYPDMLTASGMDLDLDETTPPPPDF